MMWLRSACLSLLVPWLALSSWAQNQAPVNANDVDMPQLIKETQQQVNEPGYVGLVWWMPPEYWEISAERMGVSHEKAVERYKPLRQYTTFVVAVGKIGLGTVDWFSENEIRDNVVLTDSEGTPYPLVRSPSRDAQAFASMIKPILSNIIGPTGQNCVIVFFPGSNKMAQSIASPLEHGSFSVTIKKLIPGSDKSLEWKLPLTSLSPPKYCPAGKERVQANWKYCPWHGVSLENTQATAAPK